MPPLPINLFLVEAKKINIFQTSQILQLLLNLQKKGLSINFVESSGKSSETRHWNDFKLESFVLVEAHKYFM